MDRNGQWIDRDISSPEAFMKNPAAQERAFAAFMARLEDYVRHSGASAHIGREIEGAKARFRVTEAGLMAAAHRQGAGMLPLYFRFQEENGWTSNFGSIAPEIDRAVQRQQGNVRHRQDTETIFRSIETRLREFGDLVYRVRPGG